MTVDDEISRLEREHSEMFERLQNLRTLRRQYPDLRVSRDRWEVTRYSSATVTSQVTGFDLTHSCGCCHDSPLIVRPYVDLPAGRVYSDPPEFHVGERNFCYLDEDEQGITDYRQDLPDPGWEEKLRSSGIPETVIEGVREHFERKHEV